ncbi:MAG: hypothetical protein Q8R98_16020 [Rubrivivax sp.]|nr:hypothetical protein [Rubrivivax sp.]MDP3613364.1 hypothetical protein [Rubrivivax sp.]
MTLLPPNINLEAKNAQREAAGTPAQIMVALGMMSLCPAVRGEHTIATSRAGFAFEALLDLAVKAGFPERRLFIGGLRTGKPTSKVMARAEECISLIGLAAFHDVLAWHAAVDQFMRTGHCPPGWRIVLPDEPPPVKAARQR